MNHDHSHASALHHRSPPSERGGPRRPHKARQLVPWTILVPVFFFVLIALFHSRSTPSWARGSALALHSVHRSIEYPVHQTFSALIDQATVLLKSELTTSTSCRDYFADLGIDVLAWIETDAPPFIVARQLGHTSRHRSDRACGGAQSRDPFEVIYLDQECFATGEVCELSSLLLHEIGHLARRDRTDNEPAEFFRACRINRCTDPAMFR